VPANVRLPPNDVKMVAGGDMGVLGPENVAATLERAASPIGGNDDVLPGLPVPVNVLLALAAAPPRRNGDAVPTVGGPAYGLDDNVNRALPLPLIGMETGDGDRGLVDGTADDAFDETIVNVAFDGVIDIPPLPPPLPPLAGFGDPGGRGEIVIFGVVDVALFGATIVNNRLPDSVIH
jgi:hypothetical protein